MMLDVDQTYFAMSQFFESYYWASNDDSLGELLGGVAIYRNDGIDELFDQAIAEDWKKFYYSLGSQDHSLIEGFQAVNQFTNEYLADTYYYTDLARNLVYAIRKICEMPDNKRKLHPVWQNWVAACEWITNPDVIKVEESPFVGDEKYSEEDRQLEAFPEAEILPPARPIISDGGKRKISEIQNYFIMIDFLTQYQSNVDLKRVLKESDLNKEDNQINWERYSNDVSGEYDVVTQLQSLSVVSQFMQIWVPDNALHTDLGRQLTRDIWNVIYMSEADRQRTGIWKDWMVSVDKILNG